MRKKGKRKVRCPFCGYEWYTRVEKPKECPLCKHYLISPRKSKSSSNIAGKSNKRKGR